MHVTLNRPEVERLIRAQRRQRPGLSEIRPISTMSGWITVDVSDWTEAQQALYCLAQGRIYGPQSYGVK
jgi:hypothetical protein